MLYGSKVLTANGSIPIAMPNEHIVGRVIVDFKNTAGGSYTIRPQKRVRVPAGATGDTAHSFQDTWYYKATAGPTVIPPGDQTSDGIIDVDLSGCDGNLLVTIAGGASLEVFWMLLLG